MCKKQSAVFCLCVLILSTLAEDDTTKSEELRQERTFDLDNIRGADTQEKWHAVDFLPSGSSDWIPAEGPEPSSNNEKDEIQEPVMKQRRRPGRKRKRRPQNKEHYDDSSSSSGNADDIIVGRLPPARRRPQRLDQRDENNQWRDEMMAEEPYRPYQNYNRRRLYPKYEDENNNDDEKEEQTENVEERPNRRRPYQKRKYAKPEIVTPSSSPVDLKAILKQSGGISLSELLQQRNLSLADLLKGEQHAISALTKLPEQTSEPYDKYMQNDDADIRKYSSYNRRLPSIRKPSSNEEILTTGNGNLLPELPNLEDITTERRIFVPSHPKYYTSVDYKPNMNELNNIQQTTSLLSDSSTTEQPEQTSESVSIVSSTVTFSTSEIPVVLKTKKNRTRHTLPPTLAKLKHAKTTMKTLITTETENYPKISPVPAKAIKINLNELFGMPKLVNEIPVKSTTDGPMKISVNIEQIIEKEKTKNTITSDEDLEQSTTTTEADKVKELTAKDEIMEILTDSVSRRNLTRLLELRNMTLDELVEQRERGSSQRHLADIFHNQTKEPEPTDEMIVDVVKTNTLLQPSNLFETFPAFDLRPDNNIQTTHYTRESRENQFNSKENTNNDILGKLMVPVWRQAYTNHQKQQKPDKYLEDDLIINDETRRIEDIENKLVEAVNGALNIDVINHKTYDDVVSDDDEESEFFRLPYGVRSAIIASAVIVGISILVFLTIFVVFKWTQRQNKHLNYANSFSSKIKTPILETPYQRRIFTSIMNSTFGRKKRMSPIISCNEPQSLQEYLWENDRKPFQ